VEFNPAYIDDMGRVQITIKRTNPYSELTITPESLIILSAPRSFEWNFLKCSIVIFLQIILILGLVMAGSTILSGGVNILLGLFLYFTGSAMGFFRESLVTMERAMKVVEQSIITGQALPPDADVMPLWLMKTSKFVSDFVFSLVPDLGKYDATDFLLNMRVLPADFISGALYYLGVYLLIAFIVGWIGFRSRDFK
jgi:ABC-type transport system involved in multi-copper enzyme maturation permease subunit